MCLGNKHLSNIPRTSLLEADLLCHLQGAVQQHKLLKAQTKSTSQKSTFDFLLFTPYYIFCLSKHCIYSFAGGLPLGHAATVLIIHFTQLQKIRDAGLVNSNTGMQTEGFSLGSALHTVASAMLLLYATWDTLIKNLHQTLCSVT